MKTIQRTALFALAICGTTLLLSACNKKEEPVTPPAGDVQKPMEATTGNMNIATTNAAAEAQNQVTEVKTAAETAATDATVQAQALIDRIKGLVAEKKYTEALGSIGELSKLKLTADQQKWLDDMKAKIQKAMTDKAASDAAKSAGGLLGK